MTKKRQNDTGDEPFVVTDTGRVSRVPRAEGGWSYVLRVPKGRRPRGRPAKHDWENMLHWLVGKVSKEGGLPQGRGAQAVVEGWVQEWFDNRNLNAPESLIKEHVRRIYDVKDE